MPRSVSNKFIRLLSYLSCLLTAARRRLWVPVILHWRRSHFPQIIALLRCMRGPLRQYGQHHSVCGVSWWTGSTGASNLECVLKLSAYYYANGFDSAALSLHFSATKCSGTSVVPGCTQCIAVHAQKKKKLARVLTIPHARA